MLAPDEAALAVESGDIEWLCGWGGVPPGEVFRSSELIWFVSGLPASAAHVLSGGVIYANLPRRRVRAAIVAMVEEFRSRGVPLKWAVGPSSRPVDLGTSLERFGLTREGTVVGMALDLRDLRAPEATTDFAVAAVQDAADLRDFCRVLNAAYLGVPAESEARLPQYLVPKGLEVGESATRRLYLGYWKGKAVATAQLVVVGGIANVHLVATLPHARKRGFGTAITRRALEHARDSGLRSAVLSAMHQGVRIYEGLGFREVCRIHDYEFGTGRE